MATHWTSIRNVLSATTSRRRRVELATLRFARLLGPFGVVPIYGMMFAWFFLYGIPITFSIWLVVSLGGNSLALIENVEELAAHEVSLGYLLLLALTVWLTTILLPLYSWFFRWVFISFGLLFGLTAMADRKEAELVAATTKMETANKSP